MAPKTSTTNPKDEVSVLIRTESEEFVKKVLGPVFKEVGASLKGRRSALEDNIFQRLVQLVKACDEQKKKDRAASAAATRIAKAKAKAEAEAKAKADPNYSPKTESSAPRHPHTTLGRKWTEELMLARTTEYADVIRKEELLAYKEAKAEAKKAGKKRPAFSPMSDSEVDKLAFMRITSEDKKKIAEATAAKWKAYEASPEGVAALANYKEASKQHNSGKASTASPGSATPSELRRSYPLIALAQSTKKEKFFYRASAGGGKRVGPVAKPLEGYETQYDCVYGSPKDVKAVIKAIRAAIAKPQLWDRAVEVAMARVEKSMKATNGYEGVTKKKLRKAVQTLTALFTDEEEVEEAEPEEEAEEEASEEEAEEEASEEEAESDDEEAESEAAEESAAEEEAESDSDEEEFEDAKSNVSDEETASEAGDDSDEEEGDEKPEKEEGAPAPDSDEDDEKPEPPKEPKPKPAAAAAKSPKKVKSPKKDKPSEEAEAAPAPETKPKHTVVKRQAVKEVKPKPKPEEVKPAEGKKAIKPPKKGKKADKSPKGQAPTEEEE